MRPCQVIALRTDRTVFRRGDKCVKQYAKGRLATAVLREAMNQAAAREAGANVPELIGVEADSGRWTLQSAYVEGETLASAIMSGHMSVEAGMDGLAGLQDELWRRDAMAFVPLEFWVAREIRAGALNQAVKDALLKRLSGMEGGDALCHGDLTPFNIIVGSKGAWAIADWETALRGNPAADAAMTWLSLILEEQPGWAETYLGAVHKRGRMEPRRIEMWLPIMAAARLPAANRRQRAALLEVIGNLRYEGLQ